MSVLAKLVATLAVAGGVVATVGHVQDSSSNRATATPVHAPADTGPKLNVPADKLLGQRIMVGLPGTTADAGLLDRIRRGHVGSVILFSQNITSRTQLIALTSSLQRAARQGGNPPLLIAVDQEGGQVKRLPNGPPDLSPPQIAATGSISVASREGTGTGRYLKRLGINMDLAPVLDVPTFSGAFIWQQGRAFSFNASAVAKYATPFALGLQREGVAATGKHFPGLGSAGVDTDNKLDELHPTLGQRRHALIPYRTLIGRGLDAVMVSTAGFPAYDRSGVAAAFSRPIIQGVLRRKLRFHGVAITDALGAPTGHSQRTGGLLAAEAGADILLYTDSASGELGALEQALHREKLSRSEADASYQRIVTLKRRLGA